MEVWWYGYAAQGAINHHPSQALLQVNTRGRKRKITRNGKKFVTFFLLRNHNTITLGSTPGFYLSITTTIIRYLFFHCLNKKKKR